MGEPICKIPPHYSAHDFGRGLIVEIDIHVFEWLSSPLK